MKGSILYYRKHIDNLINENPSTITIKRQVLSDDGYGGELITDTTVTERIALYDRTEKRELVSEYGKTYTNITAAKALTRYDADIKKGDVFTIDDISYRVVYPKSYRDICLQVELEVIG